MGRLWPCLILALLLSGCALRSGKQTRLIIGFGIVSVSDTNTNVALVTRTKAIGFSVSDQPGLKFGAGYSSSVVVAVKTNANLLIEVDDRPGEPLKVSTQ